MDRDPVTERIIGCAIEVHRALGPGLLESAYERCLAYELGQRGMQFRQQVPLPVEYKGARIECGYRIDLLVDDTVIVELKSVDQLAPVHEAQLLTYMKLACIRTGLLINFNQQRLIDGLRRFKL
jgi:GxxExxY protein